MLARVGEGREVSEKLNLEGLGGWVDEGWVEPEIRVFGLGALVGGVGLGGVRSEGRRRAGGLGFVMLNFTAVLRRLVLDGAVSFVAVSPRSRLSIICRPPWAD